MIFINKIFFSFSFFLIFILIEIINIPYSFNSTLEEVRKAIQEISYSYYMRGKYIQYNDKKESFFPPEDATQQNINFLVCTTFTRTVYIELLNISIPGGPETLLSYSSDNLGSPEVIAYSKINKDNKMEMFFYSPGHLNNLTSIVNPSLLDDIMPIIEIGDVFTHSTHAFLIYDIERDKEGNVKDAIIMETVYSNYINSKISKQVTLSSGRIFGSHLDYLYLDCIKNNDFKEGFEQGTLYTRKLSKYSSWININNTKLSKNEYSILRFIHKDSKGNAILKYKANNKNNKLLPNNLDNNDIIELPKKNIDRIYKFNHLYIEKIVNKFNEGIVEIGDILIYKIIIRHEGEKEYNYDLIVTENLSPYVTYETHYETKMILSFKYNINNKTLIWNTGKLSKGEEIVISYFVKITSGKFGDIIESKGFVGNIPSSIVTNIIGINLDNKKKELIKTNFDKLKNKYNGKILINEIYKKSFNKNIKFDEFDITKLIINTELNSTATRTIYLNKNNIFYGTVLNKYWSTLAKTKYSYTNEQEEFDIYDIKTYGYYGDPERRQDFIYLEAFQTGDILIYLNNNDKIYNVDSNNKLIKKYITFENGEYSYIFIEGQGFVGVNLGNDKNNNIEKRNEFNAKYYKDNKIDIIWSLKNSSDEFLEIANLQTLFGKDYYVILRPSLSYEFKYNNNNNLTIITLSVITIRIFLISISIVILKYKKNNLKNNNDDKLISKADIYK